MTPHQEPTKDSLQIARLEVQFSHLRETMEKIEETQALIRSELSAMKEEMSIAKGGWRMVMVVGSAFAAFGGGVVAAWEHIKIV